MLQLVDQLFDAVAPDAAARAPQPWERFSLRALVERLVAAQRLRVEAAGLGAGASSPATTRSRS
ncbi:MAG: hypothetical protein IPG96_07990 [Proteobacteria bacterium]|nr:hypothetical protein [Pseudomonadota bacterium]